MSRNGLMAGAVLAAALLPGCAEERQETAAAGPTTQASTPAATSAASATRDPAALMAVAPELTHRSATLALAHTPAGITAESTAEQAFVLATAGFEHARPQDLTDLRRLMERVYSSLTPQDREWMPTYLDRLRKGDLSATDSARGRTLLTSGITRLSDADRQRLQSIFEQAVVEGIARRRSAEARTAAYREPARPTPTAPGTGYSGTAAAQAGMQTGTQAGTQAARANSPSDTGRSDGRDEAYWRKRMDAARDRVRKAEQDLAEAESQERTFVPPGTTSCSSSDRAWSYKEYQECIAIQTESNQADMSRARASSGRVRQSRAQLEASRKGLEALEEEARRAGALPGWTR